MYVLRFLTDLLNLYNDKKCCVITIEILDIYLLYLDIYLYIYLVPILFKL